MTQKTIVLGYTSLYGRGEPGINDGWLTSGSLELVWLFVIDIGSITKSFTVYEISR